MPDPLIVAFTGSRGPDDAGMPPAQHQAVDRLLQSLFGPGAGFYHGCCRGADAQAAALAKAAGYVVVARPARSAVATDVEMPPDVDPDALAAADRVLWAAGHFRRNRDLVDACDLLVAAPAAYAWPVLPGSSGGTAYTVNYARRHGKRVYLLDPAGGAVVEGGD